MNLPRKILLKGDIVSLNYLHKKIIESIDPDIRTTEILNYVSEMKLIVFYDNFPKMTDMDYVSICWGLGGDNRRIQDAPYTILVPTYLIRLRKRSIRNWIRFMLIKIRLK